MMSRDHIRTYLYGAGFGEVLGLRAPLDVGLDALPAHAEAGDAPAGLLPPQEVRVRRGGERDVAEAEVKVYVLHAALHPSLTGRGGPVSENSLREGHGKLHIPTGSKRGACQERCVFL